MRSIRNRVSDVVWVMAVSVALGLAGKAQASPIYAVNTLNNLLRFDSSTPGAIITNVPLSGLLPHEQILGIDFRPLNGQLFGLGSTSRLYTINTRRLM